MKLCMKRGLSNIRQMSGPFQNPIAGGIISLVRQRSQEKHLCQSGIYFLHQDHLPAKRWSKSQRCVKLGLRISVMQWLTRMQNKPFFDPAVCEKTSMRLVMNLNFFYKITRWTTCPFMLLKYASFPKLDSDLIPPTLFLLLPLPLLL